MAYLMLRRALGATAVALALAALAIGFDFRHASAAGVVGNGTPASCTGAAFAAAMSGGGNVTFNCGPNPVTIVVTTSVLSSGQSANVNGAGRITLDGSGNVQLFLVTGGGDLTLRNISLNQGTFGSGGALFVDTGGKLLLDNVTVANSLADGTGNGGALLNRGTATISDSSFESNRANSEGGAIYSGTGSILVISGTNFSNNQAIDPVGTNANGGAVYFAGSQLNVDGVLFRRNTAERRGGALYVAGGQTTVVNTTFTDNKATGGGGLFAAANADIVNATFFRNHADNAGGIWRFSGVVSIRNTVVALSDNVAETFPSLECDGPTLLSNGNNLVSDTTCVDGANPTDQRGDGSTELDPKLGPLQDNGGPTFSILPQLGSPLIDTGSNTNCPATDQRGVLRPFGSACEIGATEYAPGVVPPPQPGPIEIYLPTVLREE
jgi:predicted outer membrane repeat protein